MPFVTTANKDLLRKRFDLIAIKDHSIKSGKKKLTYFGLPGKEILDILQWKNYLGVIIAAERDVYSKHFMRSKAFSCGFTQSNFQILFGEIDDILLNGIDSNGTKPKEEAFDVINLDYQGGLLYSDLAGSSKRVKAIKRLFDIQEHGKRDFLLFLTVNARNRDHGEFNKTLGEIKEELEEYGVGNVAPVIDWYENAGIPHKLKVYLPFHLNIWARSNSFQCSEVKAVTYLGTSNVRMVHFACSFVFGKSKLRQNLLKILSIPMYEAEEGKIKLAKMQPPII